MAGRLVFDSLAEALRQGFQVYDRTPDGYIVRKRVGKVWMLAEVCVRKRQC